MIIKQHNKEAKELIKVLTDTYPSMSNCIFQIVLVFDDKTLVWACTKYGRPTTTLIFDIFAFPPLVCPFVVISHVLLATHVSWSAGQKSKKQKLKKTLMPSPWGPVNATLERIVPQLKLGRSCKQAVNSGALDSVICTKDVWTLCFNQAYRFFFSWYFNLLQHQKSRKREFYIILGKKVSHGVFDQTCYIR